MRVLGIDPSSGAKGVTGVAQLSLPKRSPLRSGVQPNGKFQLVRKPQAKLVKSLALVRPEWANEIGGAWDHSGKIFSHYAVQTWADTLICIEVPVYGRSPKTLIAQSMYIGALAANILSGLGEYGKVDVQLVNPSQVKSALGVPWKQRKDKRMSIIGAGRLLQDDTILEKITDTKEREAIADAIGVAYAGYLLSSN